MQTHPQIEFGHEDRERIFDYVEEHGSASVDEVRDALRIDPGGMRHHVAILRRDGHLEEEDGVLRIRMDREEAEEHRGGDVAFTIRPARQDDLSGLVGAIRQVAGEKRDIVAETVADVIDHEEVLLRHNELEARMFFVATVNDEVVGWVHLRAPEMEKLRHTAELTVGVLDEYRDNGIGSHLLHRGLEWAANNGYEKIYQSLPSTNERAVDFLEEHGWEVEAVRENHYKLNGEYLDEVMLAVTLD